jgi:transcriptional regulator with XRE-family HTH domain
MDQRRYSFARWLRLALDDQDLTLGALAWRIGVRPSTVESWSLGAAAPAPNQIRALAEALGAPVEELREVLAGWGRAPDRAIGPAWSA